MKPTLSTRKPVNQFTIEDLQTFPVWEFAMDEEGQAGHDETWVRPMEGGTVPQDACSIMVAATFSCVELSDLTGFMTVTTAKGEVKIFAGAIITEVGAHFIPSPPEAGFVNPGDRHRFAGKLGIVIDAAFPMTYKLHAVISGENEVREGVLK